MSESKILPVLPLRDIVVFPHMVVPLFVGREKSVRALDEIMKGEKQILLATQKNSVDDDPTPDAIYPIGVIATVLQLLKLPDGTVKVLVEGKGRARLTRFTDREEYFEAEAVEIEDDLGDPSQAEAMLRAVVEQFENYVKLNKKVPPEALSSIPQITDASKLADSVAAHLSVKIADKQALLETIVVPQRLEKVYGLMEGEISVLQVEKKIRSRVKRQMEKTQREYYLNEQMKAIQRELGETDDARDEIMELEKRIRKTKLSKEARAKADAEVKKLRNMSPMSAEATVVRNYLDWLLSIPWGKAKTKPIDLSKAEDILDEDHYGLEKVKDRIVEYLAVQARTKAEGADPVPRRPSGRRQDLARQVDRQGDGARVRPHVAGRRARRGRDPRPPPDLYRLDARQDHPVDEEGQDDQPAHPARRDRQAGPGLPRRSFLGAARGAGPEQNNTFGDHYLEVDYDLSNVMFVTTANSAQHAPAAAGPHGDHPGSGYTEDEKVEIAKRHVLPKVTTDNGLKPAEFVVPDESIRELIRYYTREAGVRSLERALGGLARKAVREMAKEKTLSITVDSAKLADYAGVRKYRYGETEENDQVGIVTGLAWTQFGGDILTIEAIKMPGRGRMTVTGNLKDVMKESISAAASYVRARSLAFGVKPPVFEKTDIHVHVPDGATPKDGPSAGVAMTVAMVSVLTGIPIRKDIAMTGEITLRGRVTAIGGLKEKLLAALRAGVKTVLIPQENEKDLADVPDNVKGALEIVPISTADEALKWALTGALTPVEWDEAAEPLNPTPPPAPDGSAVVSH
jgi:ATP-dependent Lon protease